MAWTFARSGSGCAVIRPSSEDDAVPEQAAPASFGRAARRTRRVLRARRLGASAAAVPRARASATRTGPAYGAAAAAAVFHDELPALIGAPFAERRAPRRDQALARARLRERRRGQRFLRAREALCGGTTAAALVALAQLVVGIRRGARARCGNGRRCVARAFASGRKDERRSEHDDRPNGSCDQAVGPALSSRIL